MDRFSFEIDDIYDGERIDKVLAALLPDQSRSYIKKLIDDKKVSLLNGKTVKASYPVKYGETVEIELPDPVIPDILPQDIKLDIIYEDDDVLLVNKPKDMVVHPAPGHYEGTLVNAVMFHCKDHLSTINGVMRPGIVHRIDKDTTGVLVICKNDLAHKALSEQLSAHSITRAYRALVYNNIEADELTVDAPVGRMENDRKKMGINRKNGKNAVTHIRVLERFGNYTYIECSLETGRTHQIRVHMASIGHPLLGDTVYGPKKDSFHLQGQALHAMTLGFIHPGTGEYVEFSAPLPDYFNKLLQKLRTAKQ